MKLTFFISINKKIKQKAFKILYNVIKLNNYIHYIDYIDIHYYKENKIYTFKILMKKIYVYTDKKYEIKNKKYISTLSKTEKYI